jgi:hypothetical protein
LQALTKVTDNCAQVVPTIVLNLSAPVHMCMCTAGT